jgi:hypothetical protein
MNKVKMIILMISGLVILSIIAFLGIQAVNAEDDLCEVQGSWIGSFSGGPWDTALILEETFTPLEPNGKRLAYVMRLVNPDATFRIPPFEDTDTMSPLVGEAVRTGNRTYDIHLIGYGINERQGDRGEIKYIWTISGELTCLDEDHKTDNVSLSVYPGDADADSDGFPDEGAETFFGPTDPGPLSTATRVSP